jgi:5-methyltetrahydropteroyltriglutamate--homocysteine methyltransferase
MSITTPYRADQVGSLLRPQAIKEARLAHAEGNLDDAGLKSIEDACIKDVVSKQEASGLQVVTDGEFRRSWWHFDFLDGLDGVEMIQTDESLPFQGATTRQVNIGVSGKVDFTDHYMLDHFEYLKSVSSVTPKMTIPAPSVLHFRGGRKSISTEVYPDLDNFFADTAEAYRKAVKAFYAAGCRYLQFDDTVWAYLCSEKERAAAMTRGDNPEPLPEIYRDMINHALQDKPDDMTVTTHVCRGNFKSTWISEGGYEPVAEILLNDTNYDGYFLEYDSDRAGGFEPLRFLPKGDKRVVLGLITSKTGDLENRGNILRRIEEACAFAPLDQLCLSPQCGFASTEEGNVLTEEQQWEKLKFIVELSQEVWK